jgi:hypothetical protein
MSKKVFRHTPHRAADAMKIIVGNKTNATIRDVEETIEDIEEKEGVVISIDKDKINGDGWTVKDSDGETYTCTCASNMYQLPETEEYGGVYYPTDQVSVKFTINPMLRTNTITEITSLGEDEETLDLSKWKHGDKATTVIAKPMSAISISNAIISFNYNNTNEVTANKDEVKTKGKKTNISTENLDINSNNINIRGKSLDDYISDKIDTEIKNQNDGNINVLGQNNIGQINLNMQGIFIPAAKDRIIKDLKDPSLFPESQQRHPLLTGDNIDELYIYPNGLVTVKSREKSDRQNTDILSTHNWITTSNTYKNLLKLTVVQLCDCCHENIDGQQTYFNYCPYCKTWNTLYNNNSVITCNTCHNTCCQGCGHSHSEDCEINIYDLKKYNNTWKISAIGLACDYCRNDVPTGKLREYANYCPKCHNWGYLTLESNYEGTEEQRFLHCTNCDENYCVNCAMAQRDSYISSFLNDNYFYDDFTAKYFKIKHIRDELNG